MHVRFSICQENIFFIVKDFYLRIWLFPSLQFNLYIWKWNCLMNDNKIFL